jgi:hypothetical protein
VPAGQADAPGDDHGDADTASEAGRWDRPILLADVDRLLEGSADVEDLDHDHLRTWRGDLSVVRESLAYARAVLAGDVAILRRAGTADVTAAPRMIDDLPGLLDTDPVEDRWPESGDPDIGADLFSRTDELLSAHQEMAVVDLSSAFDVAGSLAVVEEQLAAVTERLEAVEARLEQIKAAVIRRYEEGEASAHDQPA